MGNAGRPDIEGIEPDEIARPFDAVLGRLAGGVRPGRPPLPGADPPHHVSWRLTAGEPYPGSNLLLSSPTGLGHRLRSRAAGQSFEWRPGLRRDRRYPPRGPTGGRRSVRPIFVKLPTLPGHTALLALAGSEVIGAALLVARRRVGLVRRLAVVDDVGDAPGGAGVIETTLVGGTAELAAGLDCDLVPAVGWLGRRRPPRALARAGALRADRFVACGLVWVAERRLAQLTEARPPQARPWGCLECRP
jgi:hypothetical protein